MRHQSSLLAFGIVLLVLNLNKANGKYGFGNDSENEEGGFRERGLKIHNYYRAIYEVHPLQLDRELNKLAHAHAEQLARWNSLTPSQYGFQENLWSHRGELLPFSRDVEYAVKCWYTGSTTPGRVRASIDYDVLHSSSVNYVGFGVGTYEHHGEGYSVVVALYQ